MDQLLDLTERTDGGLSASPAKREQIAELVEELEQYCPRNPLRSPLLFGDYEVRRGRKQEGKRAIGYAPQTGGNSLGDGWCQRGLLPSHLARQAGRCQRAMVDGG